MLKNIVKNNYKAALITTLIFMFFLTNFSNVPLNYFISFDFINTFIMYFGLFIIAIHSFKNNKLIGVFLSITIFFIPPEIFPNYSGLLYPVTYLSFITYLGYLFSKELFMKWKNNQ
tara:strand:+ start:8046 stop:8393 length:348 start_codon:yes stop_codon:yes gene_type:complete